MKQDWGAVTREHSAWKQHGTLAVPPHTGRLGLSPPGPLVVHSVEVVHSGGGVPRLHLWAQVCCCCSHFPIQSGCHRIRRQKENIQNQIKHHARSRQGLGTGPPLTGADMCKTGAGVGRCAGASTNRDCRRRNHERTEGQAGR